MSSSRSGRRTRAILQTQTRNRAAPALSAWEPAPRLLSWLLCAEDLGFLGREFLVSQDALLEKVAELLQLGDGVIAQPPGRGRDHSRCYRRCGRLLIGERSRDLGVHLRLLLLRPGLPV